MPTDDKLHPAHVVAIRPDVDGMLAKRGDYVLSVQTPAGTRNVVMPVAGTIKVHVSLMQELEPQTALFSVVKAREVPTPPLRENASASVREAPSVVVPKHTSADAASPSGNAGRVMVAIAFCFLALVFAAFLPGMVFGIFENSYEISGSFMGVALGVGFLLLTSIWLLSRLRFLSTRAIGGFVASVSLVIFAGLLVLGILFPQVRDIQKDFGAPFASFAKDQLQLISNKIGIAGFWPSTAPQTVISLSADNIFSGDLFEPQIGEIILVGFNFCPRGWAQADGQLINVVQNTALFSLFGTSYGGDGRATFGLPDLRGRAPMHIENGKDFFINDMGQRRGRQTTKIADGSDNMQIGMPDLVMNYCIALSGIYPSRS